MLSHYGARLDENYKKGYSADTALVIPSEVEHSALYEKMVGAIKF